MVTLEKKLQELETEIRDVTGTAEQPTDAVSGKIEQRIGFLAKLLDAEFASRTDIPDELRQMRERLAVLDAGIRDRNCEDSLSMCSDCTHALLHDHVLEFAAPISESERCYARRSEDEAVDVKDPPAAAAAVVEEEEEMDKGRGICVGLEKFFVVFSCGVLVGSIFALKLLSPANEFSRIVMDLPPT